MASRSIPDRLRIPQYPRSSAYDSDWLLENMMGPNPLWLTESLLDHMALQSGDRVLDLGCGKALSSIFLARETGAQIAAVDLWIPAEENRERIAAAGLTDRIDAIHADARSLPFDDESFDALVSVDAFHYFGTEAAALAAVLRVLRHGGRMGIVVPGLTREAPWPQHLEPWWEDGFATFHGAGWWREHLVASGLVRVDRTDMVPAGHEHWLRWASIADDWAAARGKEPYRREVAMLSADHEPLLGFVRVIARKL